MSNTAHRTPSNALDLQQQLGRVLVNGLECKLIAKDELRAMAQRASALQVRECALAGLEASGPLSNQTLAKFERALGHSSLQSCGTDELNGRLEGDST